MFLPSNYAFTLAINISIFLVLYKLHSVNGPLEFKERQLQFREREHQLKFDLERKEHEERIKDQR